jgi:hypothetical protein
MTRHTQLLALSELKALRIVCKNETCQTAVEIPLAKLFDGVSQGKCPSCGRPFRQGYPDTDPDPMHALLVAIRDFAQMERYFDISIALDEQDA